MNHLTIAGSAVGSKCCNWIIRKSEVSETGVVLVAKFKSFNQAKKFAKKWTSLTGLVKIRINDGFFVSIPVDKPYFINS